MSVMSIDPRTGRTRGVVAAEETTSEQLDLLARQAVDAFHGIRQRGRPWRAGLLRVIAEHLEENRELIVATGDGETALGGARLNGELTRTIFQFRLFAEVVDDGGYLEATIDHAAETAMGPRPDLRRMLVPTGPVAVFGASNFPLAFSVPGGDTASALAAGCPVLAKAHESHPATSKLCGEILTDAAANVGAPTGTIAVVFGRAAGAGLVQHSAITAVGFTGSLGGGRALMELISQRPDPIPFYGELGSINPLIVTEAAAIERGPEIGRGFADSFTLGTGQFCTKPGLALVPHGPAGDSLVQASLTGAARHQAGVMLNANIAQSFREGVRELAGQSGVTTLTSEPADDNPRARATLLAVEASSLTPRLLEECFGPVAVVVRYSDADSLGRVLGLLPASLTATVHTGTNEMVDRRITQALEDRAGRIVYNGFPTGVAVSWAQHHGGPWPASNSLHTSVGATAVRRFLRPIAWQDAPTWALPAELQNGAHGIPQRIDGHLRARR